MKINQGLQIPISKRLLEPKEGALFYITNEFLNPKSDKRFYIENASDNVICNEDDILMTRTGNTGKVVTNVAGAFHNNFFRIAYPKSVSKIFLYNYLLLPRIQNFITRLAGTSTIPDLNHSDFYKINFIFPSIEEQHKIADLINLLDIRIQTQNEIIDNLNSLKRGLLQKIFNQEIRFKDGEGTEFPEWQDKCLGKIGKTLNGLTGKSKDDFGTGKPYIQYKQIFDNSKIDLSKCGKVQILETEKQTKIQYGDVFFTTSSETPNEIATSSVLLDEVDEIYLNSFCFGYRVSNKVLRPEFAQFIFRSDVFRKKITPLAQGSTRYNISKSAFVKLTIKLPVSDEQVKISNFLTSIDEKIEMEKQLLEQYESQKKYLLQNLFI